MKSNNKYMHEFSYPIQPIGIPMKVISTIVDITFFYKVILFNSQYNFINENYIHYSQYNFQCTHSECTLKHDDAS